VNLNVPLSGLQGAAFRQGVVANNVANLNTPGYAARSVVSSEAVGGGVRVAEVRQQGEGVDLNTEVAGSVLNVAAYKANAAVVRAEDELLGALLDITR
jgi:flagellar basal body rod protein FlgB